MLQTEAKGREEAEEKGRREKWGQEGVGEGVGERGIGGGGGGGDSRIYLYVLKPQAVGESL